MRPNYLVLLLLIFLFPFTLRAAPAETLEPLFVRGSFSTYANTSADTRAFDKEAREQELKNLRIQLKEGKYQEVITRINSLTARNFLDESFYILLAIAYDGLEDVEKVVYYSTQAIAVSPQDPRAYLLRASAYLKQENLERAKYDLDTALKLNPSSELGRELQAKLAEKSPELVPAPVQRTQPVRRPTDTPHWMIIYLVAILLALLLFLYCRYEDLFTKPKNEFSRREVEVKEQYDFIRQIGEGGMGKVYEAYDKVLKRKVAIKRVRPELVRSAYVRDQFMSEARMVALLRHPNIVEIYTVIESESALYLVFEYVDGQTLETRLDIDGRLPFSQAKEIFSHVCAGLEYAHSQDIIHCDLKPGNIMILENNNAKVMDFGVAKKAVEQQTGARTVAGTPAYMAPEQQKGYMRKQSDVFSLALCLYEALVGQVPWTVKGFDIATKKIVPVSRLAPSIPPQLDEVLEKALKEDPNERTQSVAEFWKEVEAIEPLPKEEDPTKTHY